MAKPRFKKTAKTALKSRANDASLKSNKTWKSKSVFGYVVTAEDGSDHKFENMHDALEFYWS